MIAKARTRAGYAVRYAMPSIQAGARSAKTPELIIDRALDNLSPLILCLTVLRIEHREDLAHAKFNRYIQKYTLHYITNSFVINIFSPFFKFHF